MNGYHLPSYCLVQGCNSIAEDEYHFEVEGGMGVWKLCYTHCVLAIEMVECVWEVVESKGEQREAAGWMS